jgi:predicted nuclease of restriction endonuclease-like (RecB) superfamily
MTGKDIKFMPQGYKDFLLSIKRHIHESRIRAYNVVNRELIELYWGIGREIAERQERDGWGKSVVERLSNDLREEFPGTTGFSSQNLWYMRQFYLEYKDHPNLQQLVGEIPWGQNLLIVSKIKDIAEQEYYIRMTAEMGWSRSILLQQIKGNAYHRHKKAVKQHNFRDTLPAARLCRLMRQ